MSKTVTIVFSVALVILVGACAGLAAWASSLGGQINTLNDDTLAFMADTADQFSVTDDSIAGVGSELTAFRSETADEFDGVQGDITSLDTNLNSFKSATNQQIGTLNNSVDSLDSNLMDLGTQVDESTMNVRQVYDSVINGVCKIYGDTVTGSGFIYNSDGYIVTCWHVIDGQNNIYVMLHDGSLIKATVIGSDRYSDVAVIKIPGNSGMTPLPVADSGAIVAGEPLIVVGNPLGIFEAITYGVVSRTNYAAAFPGENWMITNLIQYDAPSNPGNSGGPVFNKEGQVIGIVSWGYSANNDMSYAVSSNKIKKVAAAIINDGAFTNAHLPGTWIIDDLTPSRVVQYNLDSIFGVLFLTAIGVGDIQEDDVAVAVDGVSIRDIADLFSYIAEFKSVGDTMTLTVIRNGTEIEVDVVLEEGWIFYN